MTKPRKKLEGNGFWESSRMMLQEHRVAIQEERNTSRRRQRIELDEDEWERISMAMTESLELRTEISLRMYHPIEELTVQGVVERVDQFSGRFMVDGEWFKVRDIERIIAAE